MARAAEVYLRLFYKSAKTDEEIEKELEGTDCSAPVEYVMPKSLRLTSHYEETTVNGSKVFRLRGKGEHR